MFEKIKKNIRKRRPTRLIRTNGIHNPDNQTRRRDGGIQPPDPENHQQKKGSPPNHRPDRRDRELRSTIQNPTNTGSRTTRHSPRKINLRIPQRTKKPQETRKIKN